jgi:acyl-coenzyme A thioesterase PaaI-like protein
VIMKTWNQLAQFPGGRMLFNLALSFRVPYTGTVHPNVLELRPGFCRAEMKDRRGVRNHLRSVHAAALMNFAEVASGLALNAAIPDGHISILTGFSIDYLKKARGTLTTECNMEEMPKPGKQEVIVKSVVKDDTGTVVAEAQAKWLLAPHGS